MCAFLFSTLTVDAVNFQNCCTFHHALAKSSYLNVENDFIVNDAAPYPIPAFINDVTQKGGGDKYCCDTVVGNLVILA